MSEFPTFNTTSKMQKQRMHVMQTKSPTKSSDKWEWASKWGIKINNSQTLEITSIGGYYDQI